MLKKPVHPLTPYPRGWYLAAYSDELPVGGVLARRYFGQDLVVFRDQAGQAQVAHAHCPHFGAHLGHGGKIVGDCIRCPFHGWEFKGSTGECVRIANGNPVPPKARLERWPVVETQGMLLFWFHEAGAAPQWQVGEFENLDEEGWSGWHHTEWNLSARIQDLCENDADVAHSPVVHGFTDSLPELEMDAEGPRCIWKISADINLASFGLPKLPALGPLALLPSRLPSKITVTRYGLSVGWVQQLMPLAGGLSFRTQTLVNSVPLDEEHTKVTVRHRVRRLPTRLLTDVVLHSYSRVFNSTVEEDIKIWEHKIYRTRPVASKSDWAVLRFRSWSRQFYDPAAYDAAFQAGAGVQLVEKRG